MSEKIKTAAFFTTLTVMHDQNPFALIDTFAMTMLELDVNIVDFTNTMLEFSAMRDDARNSKLLAPETLTTALKRKQIPNVQFAPSLLIAMLLWPATSTLPANVKHDIVVRQQLEMLRKRNALPLSILSPPTSDSEPKRVQRNKEFSIRNELPSTIVTAF